MIRTAMLISQHTVACIGIASSFTYAMQAWSQIKRHGLRHWLEVGFERFEERDR